MQRITNLSSAGSPANTAQKLPEVRNAYQRLTASIDRLESIVLGINEVFQPVLNNSNPTPTEARDRATLATPLAEDLLLMTDKIDAVTERLGEIITRAEL